ncbi:MAG: CoA-binding protein [Chloroflexi bacterium]|nr:CoA-binding protein [Chloroflexota bacterium]
MDTLTQMKLFMEPRSIAVVGATTKTGADSFNIVERLTGHGYRGRIYPVNPKAGDVIGIKAYPRVSDLPEKVDLAVIPVWERSVVPGLLQECIDAGIRAVVVVTQGFADGDSEGRKLQERISLMAKESGVRILGPNSLGVANAFTGLNTSFVPHEMQKIPLGIICQSGLFFSHMRSQVTLGKGIDVANGCDIHIAESLEYYEHDPEVNVILIHTEGIRDGRRFMETARRVSRKKPVIVLKTARSERGARAAQSHTGSLSGRDEVLSAALKQCGVVPAGDLDDAEDLTKAFLKMPLMKGKRVGIVSMSGGAGVMLVDACSDFGLEPAELTTGTQAKLLKQFPPWMKATNPMDLWPISAHSGMGLGDTALAGLSAFMADPNVDGVIFAFGTVFLNDALQAAPVVPRLMEAWGKPVCWWTATGAEHEREVEVERQGGVLFPSAARAARVLRKLNDYWRFLQTA